MKKKIKKLFISILNLFPIPLSYAVGNKIFGRKIRIDLEQIFEKNFPKNTLFKFILIGGNDGVTFDFIYQKLKSRDARGIIVEPSPKYFAKLKKNYSNFPNIHLVQKAIYSENQSVQLYELNEEGLDMFPEWGAGLGSLLQSHLAKFKIKEEFISNHKVEGITFDTLLNDISGFDNVDFLIIDTEGYDLEILKMIDFERFQAKIIQFEISNLSSKEIYEAKELMNKNGYFVYHKHIDFLCLKNRNFLSFIL